MATPIRIRVALIGDNYFRILVTPDCNFDLKGSAAECSEIWGRIRLQSELGGLAWHTKDKYQIIYHNITSILTERMCFSADFGRFRRIPVIGCISVFLVTLAEVVSSNPSWAIKIFFSIFRHS